MQSINNSVLLQLLIQADREPLLIKYKEGFPAEVKGLTDEGSTITSAKEISSTVPLLKNVSEIFQAEMENCRICSNPDLRERGL